MFTSDEARVFRQGDTVILRLVGLSFDSGASQIKPQNFDLLAKVEKAIDVFPRSERIPTYRLIATGYGETRPVASNETEAGRARNRRIDIVIKPSLDAS